MFPKSGLQLRFEFVDEPGLTIEATSDTQETACKRRTSVGRRLVSVAITFVDGLTIEKTSDRQDTACKTS